MKVSDDNSRRLLEIEKALLEAGITITDRRYIEHEDDTGYPVDDDEFRGGFWDDIKGGGLR